MLMTFIDLHFGLNIGGHDRGISRENLDDVEPRISGPKRPHDRVLLKEMKADWNACLDNKVGFKVSDVVLRDTALENVKEQIRSLEMKLDSVNAPHLKEKEAWGLGLQNVEETWRSIDFCLVKLSHLP
ncbi:hypothetical protein K1719_034712 [Acacia pycnantha]|nr:hypothetical protein K1719_034712 [Acacia pycnantha]